MRPAPRFAARQGRARRTGLVVAVLALAVTVIPASAPAWGVGPAPKQTAICPVARSAADPACGPVGPIRSSGGPFLRDAYGRAVILHGVDAVYKRAPYELYAAPGKAWNFTAADAKAIAGLGFDVVRLGIVWQGIEPGTLRANSPSICTPGSPGRAHQWNQAVADAYLAKVRQTVDLLGHYGIFTLLDMHQDVYNPIFAGEGAPNWAVCTDGLPPTNTGNWVANYGEPAVAAAYSHFWNNDVVGNLQGNYDRAWMAVAKQFDANPNVLGYDLFNEPFSSVAALIPPGTAAFDALLECFYTGTAHPGSLSGSRVPLVCPPTDPRQGVIPTIRSVDPNHPIFYEPDVSSDWGNADWIGPMPYRHLVLNFHDYCIAGQVVSPLQNASPVCPTLEQQTFTSQATARSLASDPANPGGPAWFMSEFGAEPAGTDLADMVALADRNLAGWAYWQWKFYNDPTGNPGEGLAGTNPTTGAPVVDLARAAILSEPYAQAVAGTPMSMGYDPTTDAFHLTYRVDPSIHQPTVVFVPAGIHYASGYCATARGARITSGADASHLTLRAGRAASTVTLTIAAGHCGALAPTPGKSVGVPVTATTVPTATVGVTVRVPGLPGAPAPGQPAQHGAARSMSARGPRLTFGVVPPQLPLTPAQSTSTLAAVSALAQGKPFLVHLYTNWADYPASLPALDAEIAAYRRAGDQVDLALRYVPATGQIGDVAGFARFVAAMVAHYAHDPAVTMIQVTNEANSRVNPAASDGAYPGAERALVAGVEAGAVARSASRSHVALGFNWFYSYGPVADAAWWARLGGLGGRRFAADVNWVGVDAYPGTYYPAPSSSLDPTDPGAIPSAEVAHILSTVRRRLMPKAGLGATIPLGFSEIGWATYPPVRTDAEQAHLLDAFAAGACQAAAADNVRFFQWYNLADSAGPTGGSSLNFGLLNVNFSPKPAFVAYQNMIRHGC
ncbi:MAG: cellulase family glycosylhydrolase [Acidimicrobiales bacterium]